MNDVIAEWAKRGGAYGVAQEQLRCEFEKSLTDPRHFLRPTVDAFRKGARVRGTKLFIRVLSGASTDSKHPLYMFSLFARMPALVSELDKALTYFDERGLPIGNTVTTEQALEIYQDHIDAENHRKSIAGGKRGGAKSAAGKRANNAFRDSSIRASPLSVADLADRYGVTPARIRRIKAKSP